MKTLKRLLEFVVDVALSVLLINAVVLILGFLLAPWWMMGPPTAWAINRLAVGLFLWLLPLSAILTLSWLLWTPMPAPTDETAE